MTNEIHNTITAVIAADVRSVHNVGSFFRTCDAAGVSVLYLCGITPSPLDRFGRVRQDVHKTALGAEHSVPWKYEASVKELILRLKEEGYAICALEQSAHSIDYRTYESHKKVALVVGNEPTGLSEEILSLCDVHLEIPMCGEKESLNVSVALGIALYAYLPPPGE